MAEDKNYLDIGFNNFLQQEGNNLDYLLGSTSVSGVSQNNVIGQGDNSGEPEIKNGSSLADLWITNSLKSKDWKPKTTGFYLNGQTGYAEFSDVHISGEIEATIGTIGGWSINATSIYTGTEDHSGYTTNAGDLTIYSNGTNASIHAKNFYIDTFGVLTCAGAVIDETTTVGGRLTSVLASAIDSSGAFINANLDTSAKTILGEFTFSGSGALAMNTDVNNGLWLSPTGILGKKAGTNTFAIDTSGNASFTGTITSSTITGGTIQTSTDGLRILLDGSTDQLQWKYDSILYGDMELVSYVGGYTVHLETNDGDVGAQLGVQAGDVPGAFLQYNGSGIWVDTSINMGKNVIPDSTYDLGSSGSRWGTIYSGALNLSGNITISGTVDGVDVGSHTHSGAGQGGTVSHSSIGSVTSDQHHARSHNHSSASDGTTLAPAAINCSGNITLSGGAGKYLNCNSGYIDNCKAVYLAEVASVTAAKGVIYYDSDDNRYKGYNGANWVYLDYNP